MQFDDNVDLFKKLQINLPVERESLHRVIQDENRHNSYSSMLL
jgi:hypothetical protein